jgi:hypothetical protein
VVPDSNPRGLVATSAVPVAGQSSYLSDDLNERQLERTGFGQLSFLHDNGPLTLQLSAFARYSALSYRPDTVGELIFNGLAQDAFKSDLALGLQADASLRMGRAIPCGSVPLFSTTTRSAIPALRSSGGRHRDGEWRAAVDRRQFEQERRHAQPLSAGRVAAFLEGDAQLWWALRLL